MIFINGKSLSEAKAESEAKARADEKASILAALDELDRKSARALRSVVAGAATDADKARLVELEAEAMALRARLVELG